MCHNTFGFGLIGLMKVNKQIINVHAAAAVLERDSIYFNDLETFIKFV